MASCFTIVALTPCAVYAVVRVAVGSGMLTKSVTVCSPAALESGVGEVSDDDDDDAGSELVVAAVSVDTEPNVEFPLSTPHHGQPHEEFVMYD